MSSIDYMQCSEKEKLNFVAYYNNFLYSLSLVLLLARLMGQYSFASWRLSSSVVVCNAAGGRASGPDAWAVGRRRAGRVGGRHCTAGQYGYIPLGGHLVLIILGL